jgi:molybdopterin-guanine dinucleotide biosynthesis protein A
MKAPASEASDQDSIVAEYERIATEVRAKAAAAPDSEWEIGTSNVANQPQPVSVRMSKPLVDAIDALAAKQDRKRTGMIQHILWEYVRANPIEPKP